MNRRYFIKRTTSAGFLLFIPASALVQSNSATKGFSFPDTLFDKSDLIPAPDNPDEWAGWLSALHQWRLKKRAELHYDGSSYLSEPFRWVSSDFACCFIMMCDSDFYDQQTNTYNVQNLIARGKKEYGGYDSVVLWHAYPRIGLDNRNQFDFYRGMPGGLKGIKAVTDEFHNAGIKVFIDYNPWDTGTRREEKNDIELLVDIIRETGTDGIFLDTMKDAPGFREKIDGVKEGIVLEGEIALPIEHIQTHHMSWAQWFPDSKAPGVYRNKWFERHHMQHAIARWDSDKSALLHTAWMNGSGMLIWENVFGQWLGWNERDKSTCRMMQRIQHQFSNIFSGDDWTPLSARSEKDGIYISSWGNEDLVLHTLINRNEKEAEGILFRTSGNRHTKNFNLITGEEAGTTTEKGTVLISGRIGPRGIGGFISVKDNMIDNELLSFLNKQKELVSTFNEDTEIPELSIMVTACPEPVKKNCDTSGMAIIPPADVNLHLEYRFREPGGFGNIREHLELVRSHPLHSICSLQRKARLEKFAIDKTPVTNLQFKRFLDSTGYVPAISESFLKHWIKGKIPQGMENHPVVYVDYNDAVAYAGWAGKRLPSIEEWQYAAEGLAALLYPWGNTMEPGRCNPDLTGKTTPVDAFPSGSSPYGCLDMCGNVWEMTSELYTDGRTRFIMLKGGSCYRAEGSEWYFDGGPQKNSFTAKMLLIWPGLDRCSSTGFRCASDLTT